MSLKSLRNLIVPDGSIVAASNAPAFSATLLLDASTERAAFIFQVPKTGTLDKAEFRAIIGVLAGGSVLRASFQDVSTTTGDPDGTQDQFRDISGLSGTTWVVPGLMTSDGTDGGVKRSVTRGEWLALVIEYQTFTLLDSIVISSFSSAVALGPYSDQFTLGAWVKQTSATPLFALKYSDGTYDVPDMVYPFSAINSPSFSNASTPDERGMLFNLPFSATVRGVTLRADLDGDCDVVLYDVADVVLASVSLDASIRVATSPYSRPILFPASVSIDADTDYRVVVKPTTATSVILYDFEVSTTQLMAGTIGQSNHTYTERTDAGAWTNTATKRPFMALILDAVESGGAPILVNGGLVQ